MQPGPRGSSGRGCRPVTSRSPKRSGFGLHPELGFEGMGEAQERAGPGLGGLESRDRGHEGVARASGQEAAGWGEVNTCPHASAVGSGVNANVF